MKVDRICDKIKSADRQKLVFQKNWQKMQTCRNPY